MSYGPPFVCQHYLDSITEPPASAYRALAVAEPFGNLRRLRWAFAEAAVLFIRQSQPGKEYFATLEHQHGKAKALTVLAHKLGRAVNTLNAVSRTNRRLSSLRLLLFHLWLIFFMVTPRGRRILIDEQIKCREEPEPMQIETHTVFRCEQKQEVRRARRK